MRTLHHNSKGFTLLEVIIVMLMIGILTASILAKWTDIGVSETASQETIKSHLRYAQLRAMSSNEVWGIDFKGNTYTLFRGGDTTDMAYFPGKEDLNLQLPKGISATEIVSFDSDGKPYSDAAGTSALSANHQIGNSSIEVTKNTGFIK